MSMVDARSFLVASVGSLLLAGALGAQGVPALPAVERISGTIAATLPGGAVLRGAHATVYVWADTPELRNALALACDAARREPQAWIAARTELESPSGMPLDSATKRAMGLLHGIVSTPHDAAQADAEGRFAVDSVPLGEYWVEAEMLQGSGIVQWWHHLAMGPAEVAAAQLRGYTDVGTVELGPRDFTRDEFCAGGAPLASVVSAAGDAASGALSADSVYTHVDEAPRLVSSGNATLSPGVRPPSNASVDAEFVVNTDGHADMSTLRIVGSADMRLVDYMRRQIQSSTYEPARLKGAKVRAVMRQSIEIRTETRRR